MLHVHGSYSSLYGLVSLAIDRPVFCETGASRAGASAAQTFLSGDGFLLSDEAIDAGDHHLGSYFCGLAGTSRGARLRLRRDRRRVGFGQGLLGSNALQAVCVFESGAPTLPPMRR